MALDLSTDYLIIDGLEEIIHTSVTRTGDFPTTIASGWKTAIKEKEGFSTGGVYNHADALFRLPSVLVERTPKPGDLLTVGDIDYTILTVDTYKFDGSWKCTARDLILAYDLRDKIKILRGTVTVDSFGSKIVIFVASSWYAARIQPESIEEVDERGKRGFTTRYDIVIGSNVELEVTDLLQDEAGTKYQVITWRDHSSIQDLQVVTVEVTP